MMRTFTREELFYPSNTTHNNSVFLADIYLRHFYTNAQTQSLYAYSHKTPKLLIWSNVSICIMLLMRHILSSIPLPFFRTYFAKWVVRRHKYVVTLPNIYYIFTKSRGLYTLCHPQTTHSVCIRYEE